MFFISLSNYFLYLPCFSYVQWLFFHLHFFPFFLLFFTIFLVVKQLVTLFPLFIPFNFSFFILFCDQWFGLDFSSTYIFSFFSSLSLFFSWSNNWWLYSLWLFSLTSLFFPSYDQWDGLDFFPSISLFLYFFFFHCILLKAELLIFSLFLSVCCL